MYDSLQKTLQSIDRPGDVCIAGDVALTLPGIEIEGMGLLALPLVDSQASTLIAQCRQAPYGKGTETLVDTSVRNVWELDAEKIQFTNPDWNALIDSIVATVRSGLGLKGLKLSAHLYKLLVYETGSFFLPHRDGEHLDGMVASLVVVLPTAHTGGELIVRHDGASYPLTFPGAASGFGLSYAAFYADCEHEIKPVTSGYRLCLTYNLTLESKPRKRSTPQAPSYGNAIVDLTDRLNAWYRKAPNTKLAIALDHQYTAAGLSIDTLKGVDRARATVLFEAAQQANCHAYLALLTLWQLGEALDDSFYDDEDPEMGEIFETNLSANHWSGRNGECYDFGELPVEDDEILIETDLASTEPSEEEYEGYTGNAGMTLQRWYHRAVIMIWPHEAHFEILSAIGLDGVVGGFESMLDRVDQSPSTQRAAQREECARFAQAIIDNWSSSQPTYYRRSAQVRRQAFLPLLCRFDEPTLVGRFIDPIMVNDGTLPFDETFVDFLERHQWQVVDTELQRLIDEMSVETLVRTAQWLRLLCTGADRHKRRLALCQDSAKRFVTQLTSIDQKHPKKALSLGATQRKALLVDVVEALLSIDAEALLSQLIDHTLEYLSIYPVTDGHLAAIFTLEPRLKARKTPSRAIDAWLAACEKILGEQTREAPAEPTDYRRASRLGCRCEDCAKVSHFLASRTEKVLRLALKQERRAHLHYTIDRAEADLTHETERRGRPYTLVCTKTLGSYHKAVEIHQRDLRDLARVSALRKGL